MTPSQDKLDRYRELVTQRKRCRYCHPRLINASEIDGGSMDCDRVGAYSQWQGNLCTELMVVAQDFADVDGFRAHGGWPGRDVKTNERLTRLINEIGIAIKLPERGVPDDRLFFTNAVLCMKDGGMRGPIRRECVEDCGRKFLRPLVELVEPSVLVALGGPATLSIHRAFGLEPPARLADVVATAIALTAKTTLIPLYHPTASCSRESQQAGWAEVREVLDVRSACRPVTHGDTTDAKPANGSGNP